MFVYILLLSWSIALQRLDMDAKQYSSYAMQIYMLSLSTARVLPFSCITMWHTHTHIVHKTCLGIAIEKKKSIRDLGRQNRWKSWRLLRSGLLSVWRDASGRRLRRYATVWQCSAKSLWFENLAMPLPGANFVKWVSTFPRLAYPKMQGTQLHQLEDPEITTRAVPWPARSSRRVSWWFLVRFLASRARQGPNLVGIGILGFLTSHSLLSSSW